MARKINPPPNLFRGDREALLWVNEVIKLLTQASELDWDLIDKTGSNLTDIETRLHSSLQSIGTADPTDTDTTRDKHVSNNDMKLAADHRSATNAHGATGDIVGTGDAAGAATRGAVFLAAAVADASAPSAYTPHASGAVAVTSNAATDLDTTAAAVKTLRDEVDTLTTKMNTLMANLRTSGALDT